MNDLLPEILEEQHQVNGAVVEVCQVQVQKQKGKPVFSPQSGSMQQFFLEVSEIKRMLGIIISLQNRIQISHEVSKTVSDSEDMRSIREDIQDGVENVKNLGHKVKNKIDKLDKMNSEAIEGEGQEVGSSSERTRTSISAGLKKKLKTQMDNLQKLKLLIQMEHRNTIQRRVFILTGEHVTDEEIEQLIESGQSELLFQQALVSRTKVADTLQEIEERHKAMKDVEETMLEIHQMFLDMSILIEQQGAILDSVEKQVERGAEYLGEGTEVLRDARRLAIQGNKYMICVLGVTAVVIIFVVGIVGASVQF